MASTGISSAIDDRFAPTTCSTVEYMQEDDQATQYPPWYNGPREGEWDVESQTNSLIDDRYGTEYSDISRVSSCGTSSCPRQEPLAQHMLKKLQRATIEGRLKEEVDVAREINDEGPVQKERDAQLNVAKKVGPERKLALKEIMGRHGHSTKLAGAMVDARVENMASPVAVARASPKAQRVEAITAPTAQTRASPLSLSAGLNGSRTVRLVSKDGRESFVQIPVFGTATQKSDAIKPDAGSVGRKDVTTKSVAPRDGPSQEAKQERQDSGQKPQRQAKEVKPAAPDSIRQRAETEFASLHKDNSRSRPVSLARVDLSGSKSQAAQKESTGLGDKVQAAEGHAASLKSSTKDSAIAFSQPCRRDSPPFQRLRTNASPASQAGKKASIVPSQVGYQHSREDRPSGKLNTESHRSHYESSRSNKFIVPSSEVIRHPKIVGEVGLPAGATERGKNNHQGSEFHMRQGHEKSSSTMEHSFARMGAFAQVLTELGSSHTHEVKSEARSTVQSAASLRAHKPKTIFAGRGWVSPHPLSEVGPPQSVIELHDENGEALRISFEDFIGIAGSEARQYVHSHLNGASSSVHSRLGSLQDVHQSRSSSGAGHSTGSPGSQSQQVFNYAASSYGQPSNHHFPTVESMRSSSPAIASQTYSYDPTAVYGDQQGRNVVYHAPASGSLSMSAIQQFCSPMAEDALLPSTLHGFRDDRPAPARAAPYNAVKTHGAPFSRSYTSPEYLHAPAPGQYHDWQLKQRSRLSPNVLTQPTESEGHHVSHSICAQPHYDPTAPSLPQSRTTFPRAVSGPLVVPLPNGQAQLSMPWDADADRHGPLGEYQRRQRREPSLESATTMPDTEVYVGEEGSGAPSKWSSVDRAERGYGSFRPAMW